MAAPTSAQQLETPLPHPEVLVAAARMAQQLDRPIQLDYYADSHMKKCCINEDPESKDKVLLKSADEYTSLIQKIYKVGPAGADDFLVLTENSIYIVSSKIEKRKIPNSQLRRDE
jgi:hypothetical protein